jgi:hypothetical protein
MSEPARIRDVDAEDSSLTHAEIYKAAIDEYRFQVLHNWSRTQYFLGFNAVILAAAVGLAARVNVLSVLVFALGAVASVMSYFAAHTQHRYYRAARDRMRRLEVAFGIPDDRRLNTTATMAGRRHPTASVTQVSYLLFGSIAVADLVGAALVLFR